MSDRIARSPLAARTAALALLGTALALSGVLPTRAQTSGGNIAGTDPAIERSEIPMEGAVADTMGEALAIDKATDRFETGRPVVMLKDGYELIELNETTLAEASEAPVFGLDDTMVGRVESMAPGTDELEGVVVIDGPDGGEPRRLRVPASRMQAVRDDAGAVRLYIDAGDEAMGGYAPADG